MSSTMGQHESPSSSTGSSPDVGSSRGKATTGKTRTRRKVAKACLACQKSHLTCDDQRPCSRCVKKGIGDQCVEGVRKKAKYLLEGEERHPTATSTSTKAPAPKTSSPPKPAAPGFPLAPLSIASDRSLDGTSRSPFDSTLPANSPFSSLAQPPTANVTSRPSFGSANYEPPNTSSTGQFVPDDVWLAGPLNDPEPMDSKWNDPFTNTGLNDDVPSSSIYPFGVTAAADEFQMFDAMFGGLSPTLATFSESYTNANDPLLLDPATLPPRASQSAIEAPSKAWENKPMATPFDTQPAQSTSQTSNNNTFTPAPSNIPSIQPAQWSQPVDKTNGVKSETAEGSGPSLGPPQRDTRSLTPGEVYRKVLKPYDYTEGYHVLMAYLTKHFERKEILRVVHALASFRPSLIALQMPMSEDDEVFIERSFQRTMIELEKLISYSATPTAVWRRTGEICYANPEFCTLSGKDSGELYGKKNYIYYLFDKSSVITYWENFSVHAFENTTQNFFQPTTIKVNGIAIPCSCCFTIRRDVFDLPSVVIGQFLRIPGDL